MNKLEKLAKDGDELLNERQRARLRQLNGIERVLFRRLVEDLRPELEEKDGRIVSRKGYASLSKLIDQVFNAVEERGLAAMTARTASDMLDVVNSGANYYRAIAVNKGGRFKAIEQEVQASMRRRLGLDPEGKPQRRGYLENLFRTEAARDEVKKMVHKSVAAGVPMRKLVKALRTKVAGTDEAAGVLEKHIGGFVLDAYNLADAMTNNQFGERLGLKYFVYSGGIIETSREFCRKRNNKVFTTEEAQRDWPMDATLPRTKAENEDDGPPADYVPLEDRGRWNCRHRLLYIDEATALQRRPDLARKA